LQALARRSHDRLNWHGDHTTEKERETTREREREGGTEIVRVRGEERERERERDKERERESHPRTGPWKRRETKQHKLPARGANALRGSTY
jgi:hypothetical protein